MWTHNMNGGGGGGGGGVILLLLFAYVVSFILIGAKSGGFAGGIVAPIIAVGLPLLMDSGSHWFPLGAFFWMFVLWIPTLVVWGVVAVLLKFGANSKKSESVGEADRDDQTDVY